MFFRFSLTRKVLVWFFVEFISLLRRLLASRYLWVWEVLVFQGRGVVVLPLKVCVFDYYWRTY